MRLGSNEDSEAGLPRALILAKEACLILTNFVIDFSFFLAIVIPACWDGLCGAPPTAVGSMSAEANSTGLCQVCANERLKRPKPAAPRPAAEEAILWCGVSLAPRQAAKTGLIHFVARQTRCVRWRSASNADNALHFSSPVLLDCPCQAEPEVVSRHVLSFRWVLRFHSARCTKCVCWVCVRKDGRRDVTV